MYTKEKRIERIDTINGVICREMGASNVRIAIKNGYPGLLRILSSTSPKAPRLALFGLLRKFMITLAYSR